MTPKKIQERIENRFINSQVKVLDLTGTQDHYQVSVFTHEFDNISKVDQHRAIMDLFSEELKSGELHALTIKTGSKPL